MFPPLQSEPQNTVIIRLIPPFKQAPSRISPPLEREFLNKPSSQIRPPPISCQIQSKKATHQLQVLKNIFWHDHTYV